ncbi:MAG: HEAT repeat domain-containing protein [Planctomycetes bacterium]|nr:HEAT repeat domain-containing protein [Planctomycetota bacterium]
MRSLRPHLTACLFLTIPAACAWLGAGFSVPAQAHEPAQVVAAAEEPLRGLGSAHHEQEVMKSTYCAECHPAIYAEHESNTHGRAFTDEEVRLATGRFSQGDCINCHTPRPVFETGIGQNPLRRHHNLVEGNTCMTCHWAEGVNYKLFEGGPDCKTSFDDRVGTVEACSSCHRNHGTPYQWELSPKGKLSDRECIECHMPERVRPVAVGEEPRPVRSHDFSGGRTASQLYRAYAYDAEIEGNEVVVKITNRGAGHNFPTELKQRSVESLVILRDASGAEVGRSRMVFRDPYKRPYGLTLPVNTQIPSGETREHRVPIGVSNGTVECQLHYKLYYPIEDYHPGLSRRLESTTLAFSDLDPSEEPIETAPEVKLVTPDGITPEEAGPAHLVDFARPPIGQVEVEIPEGDSAEDIQELISLFQFPVPAAAAAARARLVEIAGPAIPELVKAMGSWDNKTWKQAMTVLEGIGLEAAPAVAAALEHEELYVRVHAATVVTRMELGDSLEAAGGALLRSLERSNAVDRAAAAEALGVLRVGEATGRLRELLKADPDPDVVRAAARALLALEVQEAAPELRMALDRFEWDELRLDIARARAALGDPSGVPVLLAGLDHQDDLIRESFFEAFFEVTGVHMCYEPLGPRHERLADIAKLQGWWARYGGAESLRGVRHVPGARHKKILKLISKIGDGGTAADREGDQTLRARLVEYGEDALPAIVGVGMKYPAGFAEKRAVLCQALGDIGHPDAVPALIGALRDPVVSVAAWACEALSRIEDDRSLPALRRYHQRLLSLSARGGIPASAGSPEALLALAAGACYRFGDDRVESDLVGLLLCEDATARGIALDHLKQRYGSELEFDPDASADERRRAVERWQAGRR